MNPHISYRPDIDGLRAIAILCVLIFHAFPNAVTGGFIGVDVFFVISGYLISTILFTDLQKGRFSFKTFYMRRVRRLFPALITVLVATFAVGWLVLLPEEFAQLGKHIAAGMGFVANFVYLDEAGYFDKAAETKPLLHLWTLGVEEQFYIVWPVILFAAWKWGRRLFPVLAVIFIASFLYNVMQVTVDRDKAFFLPYARFWELLAGAGSAYVHLKARFDFPALKNARVQDVAACAGVGLILASAYFIHKDMRFPGFLAVLPVLGAVLLVSARQAWINRAILSHPVMVWIGAISYPLYLWHWPVLSYLHIIEIPLSAGVAFGALGVSVLLAWLTYRFIERSVRARPEARFIPHLCGMAVVLVVAGLCVSKDLMRPYLDIPEVNRVLDAAKDWKNTSPNAQKRKINGARYFVVPSHHDEEVIFLGDSNMQHFLPRVAHLIEDMPDQTYSAAFFTYGGCRPIPDVTTRGGEKCFGITRNVLEYIEQRDTVKRLVISGRWHKSIHSSKNIQYRMPDGEFLPLSEEWVRKIALGRLVEFIRDMRKRGIEVFIVQNAPSNAPGMNGPVIERVDLVWKKASGVENPYTHPEFFTRAEGVDMIARELIEGVAKASGARIIDPIPTMCGDADCPLSYDGGRSIYKDGGHVAYRYVRDHATFMDETILIKGGAGR